jgi:hypothetical protein
MRFRKVCSPSPGFESQDAAWFWSNEYWAAPGGSLAPAACLDRVRDAGGLLRDLLDPSRLGRVQAAVQMRFPGVNGAGAGDGRTRRCEGRSPQQLLDAEVGKRQHRRRGGAQGEEGNNAERKAHRGISGERLSTIWTGSPHAAVTSVTGPRQRPKPRAIGVGCVENDYWMLR